MYTNLKMVRVLLVDCGYFFALSILQANHSSFCPSIKA
jgi:hypothetical protein